MLGRLLSGGEFSQWASFVSPAFFDVMPTKALWQRATGLLRATRDHEKYARAVAERQVSLGHSLLPIVLESPAARDPARPGAPALPGEAHGAAVMELYFHQLLHGEHTLLDLRQQAFISNASGLTWRPASWIARWDPTFIAALRQIYGGYYLGDGATFRQGLGTLNLLHAEDVFRQHFGEHDVRFEVKHFVSTFHQVFVRCRDAGTKLHADFLPLGIYLASLHDHLERLGVAVDVRAAFMRASGRKPALRAPGAVHAPPS